MPNPPSHADDVFAALGIPSDPKVHEEVGIKIVDPNDHGEDYPFKLQVRRIGTGSLEEFPGTTAELPDLKDFGLELIIFAQILRADGTLSKILIARSLEHDDPTKMIGRRTWVQFLDTGVEVCCIPKPVSRQLDRKVKPDAEQRCGNCRLWDQALGEEEYSKVTHKDSEFGGDRQMFKDIADYEAKDRKLRRLDPKRIGLCLDTDTIYDKDMESCDDWVAE